MNIAQKITTQLNDPYAIEKLYRENSIAFELAFKEIYPSIQDHPVAQVWQARLQYGAKQQPANNRWKLVFVLVGAFLAGIIAKLPGWVGMIEEYYYATNFAFIAFPLIAAYFIINQQLPARKWWLVAALMLVSCVYINRIPMDDQSDTFILACIHLPLLVWALVGFAYSGCTLGTKPMRIQYLRFNGDLLIMNTIILLAGIILTALTLGLFSIINIDITTWYLQNVVVWGLAASPVVSTYLVEHNPHIVNKISPLIARIFSPLALITLVIYLATAITTGQNPYENRDFLIVFNLLLIAVMALILFATVESTSRHTHKFGYWILTLLAFVTVVINTIALSAIIYRINEWGITPNRLAVLVGNILILSNLVWITFHLLGILRNQSDTGKVENCIATFLPIYTVWTAVVVFVFPLIFGYR
ncbi:MAG: hypothetical protein ACO3O0_07040 [Bacteroidia bacterium]